MIEPLKFKKKPVVIEAVQLTNLNTHSVATWCHGYSVGDDVFISTLEGEMCASPGDYIIKGVEGEFYPCKESIFLATYEPESLASQVRDFYTARFNTIE